MSVATYPVHVDATLAPKMSRWLWLVKWLLALPHLVVLAFLWVAFVVVSVVAFFAVLFTGHYPRSLFDFNVGVLRWTWRVSYYTYGALGTDRYPPFSLADVADYPAHLEIDYPTELSRGLVLVKWWLLAIPHYLVVGVFVGGSTWALSRAADNTAGTPGLIGILVLIAAVALTFTGRYPQQIFDFVLGMNRWALRVAAYAALMTDQYPPFRIDMGGHETGATMTVAPASTTSTVPSAASAVEVSPPSARRGWTAPRVVALVIGTLLGLTAIGLLGAGGVATWATNTQRDGSGFLSTDTRTFSTASYAVTSDQIDLGSSTDWITPGDVLGTVRVRVTAADPTQAVFVGIAPQAKADAYLAGVSHLQVTAWAGERTRDVRAAGAVPPSAPTATRIWSEQSSGTGTQTLTWRPDGGQWVIVVMNASGSPNVSVAADVGATIPDLGWIAASLLIVGAALLTGAVTMVAVSAARASR